MSHPKNQILIGDCIERMRELPDGIVQCCVTSPPYFALRSYLPAGHPDKAKEIGSEPTPEAFIATMVAVFREVRRIMRDDGVLFMNLGDSYASAGGQHEAGSSDGAVGRGPRGKRQTENSGQLLNIPHRVAEALRTDGWNWRQTIIWAKKSAMPESMKGWRWEPCKVKASNGKFGTQTDARDSGRYQQTTQNRPDEHAKWSPCSGCKKCEPNGGWVLIQGKGRCTTSHEYIFVLTKGDSYFWDSTASKEPCVSGASDIKKMRESKERIGGKHKGLIDSLSKASSSTNIGQKRSVGSPDGRNPRSVWLLATESTKQKHYATFPSELVRRCLVAGTSAAGCCSHCGSPWAPMVESESVATRPGDNHKATRYGKSEANTDPQRKISISNCLGYRQSCGCPAHEAAKQIVFDPFTGLGTVQQTAQQLGHDWLGTELNPDYAAIANRRIYETPRWLLRQQAAAKSPGKKNHKAAVGQRMLNF